MNLHDVLDQINELDDDKVICARRPWTFEAEAVVGRLDGNLRVPNALARDGFEYFLEVSVAQEVLEVFGSRNPTEAEIRDLLLYYAENDAYPGWVYDQTDAAS